MSRVVLEGADTLERQLKNLFPAVARNVVRQAARESMRPVLSAMKAAAPVDKGTLANSGKLRAISRSRRLLGVEVGFDAAHSAPVELGHGVGAARKRLASARRMLNYRYRRGRQVLSKFSGLSGEGLRTALSHHEGGRRERERIMAAAEKRRERRLANYIYDREVFNARKARLAALDHRKHVEGTAFMRRTFERMRSSVLRDFQRRIASGIVQEAAKA